MQALKEKLAKKPLYWCQITIEGVPMVSDPKSDQVIDVIRCVDHLEGKQGRKVAIYQMTNYSHFRYCEHKGCFYGVSRSELP